jgi:hypothetical protein
VGAVAIGVSVERRAISADLRRPRDLHGGGYVGSDACRGCHEEHYVSWHRTFHRTMTAEATTDSVLGDFSGATLRQGGVTARMGRDARGGYQMTFASAGTPARTVEVVRTVGSRRYQQYLARVGDSYWRLPVAWHVEEQRWFPMTGAFLFSDPKSDVSGDADGAGAGRPVFGGGDFDRHVTRWNDNCVFCHNVAPNPARDPVSGRFATTVAQLGIACESCHGPGSEHVAKNGDPLRRWMLRSSGAADPTIVNPSRLSPARAADLCGRCHGQRIADQLEPLLQHGDPFVPGDDLAIESAPLWRDTPLGGDRQAFAARFWNDGTPRLTAYEYQGLLESPCTMRGPMTCTSCHGMHEGDPRGQIRARFGGKAGGKTSNTMCTGCHTALGTPEAARLHTHHDPAGQGDGGGGRCVSCHMPRIVYGVLDVHRSHRIEVPDPARAAAAGRPDACTSCHVERTVAWAEAAARRLWGGARFAPNAPPPAGTSPLEALFSGPPVARATAADALGRAPVADEGARARRVGALLEVMARDRYPAVRHLAWRSLRRLIVPAAAPGADFAADYDPSAEPAQRTEAVNRLRGALGHSAVAPPPALTMLRLGAQDRDLQIGE